MKIKLILLVSFVLISSSLKAWTYTYQVTGADNTDLNGTYSESGIFNSYPEFKYHSTATGKNYYIYYDADYYGNWVIASEHSNVFYGTYDFDIPPLTGWETFDETGMYTIAPTITKKLNYTVDPPTTQPREARIFSTYKSKMTVCWYPGNGDGCVVFVKLNASDNAMPVTGQTYTANSVFGSGSQIGTSGWYCVYNGTSSKIIVSGLTENQTYTAEVFAYAKDDIYPVYATSISTNKASRTIKAPPFALGDGSHSNPFQVSSPQLVDALRDYPFEEFIQTTDIDMNVAPYNSGSGWMGIGDGQNNAFRGIYDGQGHTIDNLYINQPSTSNTGLFTQAQTAAIKNLGLKNVNITGYVGTGSLAAMVYLCQITNCYSTGTVTASQQVLGGLIGESMSSTVDKCYSTCTVLNTGGPGVDNYRTGGLIGMNAGSSSSQKSPVRNCYATGNVTSYSGAGGLIGENNWGIVTDCYSSGNISGNRYLGGFIGIHTASSVDKCYSTGAVTITGSGSQNTGAFIGNNLSGSTVTNSIWNKTINSNPALDNSLGIGKTTAQMQTEGTYTALSWDFALTWEMIGTNYPRIRAIPEASLPVELTEFRAGLSDGSIILNWKTASEFNSYGFEIERNTSGSSWEKIGFVNGAGSSNSPKAYSFVDKNPPSGKLQYRLKQIDNDGHFKYYDAVSVESNIQDQYRLMQNSPNPFNPVTAIKFQIPEKLVVSLKVYNMIGQQIASLVNEEKPAGSHVIYWNGKDDNGQTVASGIYLYKLTAGSFTETLKMNYLK